MIKGGDRMKRPFLFLLVLIFALASTDVYAAERAPLGKGNLTLKLDYINFTNEYWSDNDDSGLYIGVEGYGEIAPNVYLGGEVGTAANIVALFGDEINYVPIELNIKYATDVNSNFVLDFGAGASYNHAELRVARLFTPTTEEDVWLFGGQFFADLTFKIKTFSIGVNAKYQVTEDFVNEDFDFNNWRVGGQIGIMF